MQHVYEGWRKRLPAKALQFAFVVLPMSISALLFDDYVPLAIPGFPRARNQGVSVQQQLALGQLIVAFLGKYFLEAAASGIGPLDARTFRFPYGFFKRLITQELRLAYTNAKRLQCRKAVEVLRAAVARGASTHA